MSISDNCLGECLTELKTLHILSGAAKTSNNKSTVTSIVHVTLRRFDRVKFWVCTGFCDRKRHRIQPFDLAVPGRGRVEVQNDEGTWGLVCDDVWNDLGAHVFCTCLEYRE